MISAGKRRANRAKARASTGPKTAPGKARAAKNALRHGLSIPLLADPVLAGEVEAMARRIVRDDAASELLDLARRIAEAQIDLLRVRRARHELIAADCADPDDQYPAIRREPFARARLLLQTPRSMDGRPLELIERIDRPVAPVPLEGPVKLVTFISDAADKLQRLDRYERRALSRRKFAIREFDAARRARSLESSKSKTV